MPYIKQEDRKIYDDKLDDLCFLLEEQGYNEGHVTYVLYKIVARWFKDIPKYSSICRIRGVLTGTKDEFDRRIAAPYEDNKCKKNGDVDLDYNFWSDVEKVDDKDECYLCGQYGSNCICVNDEVCNAKNVNDCEACNGNS